MEFIEALSKHLTVEEFKKFVKHYNFPLTSHNTIVQIEALLSHERFDLAEVLVRETTGRAKGTMQLISHLVGKVPASAIAKVATNLGVKSLTSYEVEYICRNNFAIFNPYVYADLIDYFPSFMRWSTYRWILDGMVSNFEHNQNEEYLAMFKKLLLKVDITIYNTDILSWFGRMCKQLTTRELVPYLVDAFVSHPRFEWNFDMVSNLLSKAIEASKINVAVLIATHALQHGIMPMISPKVYIVPALVESLIEDLNSFLKLEEVKKQLDLDELLRELIVRATKWQVSGLSKMVALLISHGADPSKLTRTVLEDLLLSKNDWQDIQETFEEILRHAPQFLSHPYGERFILLAVFCFGSYRELVVDFFLSYPALQRKLVFDVEELSMLHTEKNSPRISEEHRKTIERILANTNT